MSHKLWLCRPNGDFVKDYLSYFNKKKKKKKKKTKKMVIRSDSFRISKIM